MIKKARCGNSFDQLILSEMSETKSPLISAFDAEADLVELTVKILTFLIHSECFPPNLLVLFTAGLCGLKVLSRSWL